MTVCRVCLSSNFRMHRIDSIGLQEMFEEVTSTKLNADERPVTMCYICLPQLQKGHRFLKMCQTAEKTFTDLITNGIEVKNNSLGMLNLKTMQHLSLTVASTQFITLGNDDSTNKYSHVTVKRELNEVEKSAGIDHILKDEMDEQDFQIDDSIISMTYNVDESTNKSSQVIVMEELNEVEKSADFDYILKVEWDEKDFQTGDRIVSINCSNDDSHSATGGQTEFEKNANIAGTKYECDFCNKKIKSKQSLSVHIKKHMKMTPFSCNMCAKTFPFASGLKNHMRTHTGEKPYSCNRCDKAFSHSGSLKTHMRIHSRGKLYTCNICDKAFFHKWQSQTHMRNHTLEKPYSCNRCGRTFSRNDQLQTHMRIHTGP